MQYTFQCKKCGGKDFRQKTTGCAHIAYIDSDGDIGGEYTAGHDHIGKWRCFDCNTIYQDQEELENFFINHK